MDKEYLIKKWLNNDLTDVEQDAFNALDDRDLNNEIIDSATYFKASHFSQVVSFETMASRLTKPTPVRNLNWVRPLLRVASVFVIGICLYFLFFSSSLTNIETLASEKTTIDLPDTSRVTLNALSKISYHENKWDENREITLEGEAFFKVAKGEVFDVITSEGTISVLGTQFNVKQRQGYFEVKCYEGIVQVKTQDTIKKLLVGDTFRIYDGILSFSNTSYDMPQWTLNTSTFKSIPFKEVIKELERQYNITIEFDSPKLNQLFTGGFAHGDVENALKSITEPLELTYEMISSNQVRLLNRER